MQSTSQGQSGFTWRSLIPKDIGLVRLLFITAGIFVIMSVARPDEFFTLKNVRSMAFQFPEFAILSLAMMLSMLTGGIDLSIIGAANLAGIFGAFVLRMGGLEPTTAIFLAILIALTTGLTAGAINGLLISRLGIPPILATLGTSQVYMGIGIGLTGGRAVLGFPREFSVVGNGSLGPFPVPFIVFAVAAVAVAVVLNRTPFGEKIYMLGTNPLAARFAGLDNDWLIVRTYMLCGLLSSVAGVIMMSRANSAKADFGSSYLLLTILIAVLGGVNPYGGFGKVAGVFLAVLSLQFLSSGFNILRFSNFAKEFVWGALLLIVIVMSVVSLGRLRRGGRGGSG